MYSLNFRTLGFKNISKGSSSAKMSAVIECFSSGQELQLNAWNCRKSVISGTDRGTVVGARWAGASVSENADLLWSREQKFYKWKLLVDERERCREKGPGCLELRRWLYELKNKSIILSSNTPQNTHHALRRMGYDIRRPHLVPLISAKSKTLRLQ